MLEHTLTKEILDTRTNIYEIKTHAETTEWNVLGIHEKLNNIKRRQCKDCADLYELWLEEKGRHATRRNFIAALRAIGQNAVADEYVAHLLETFKNVSDTVKENLLNIFFKLHFKIDGYFNQFIVTILGYMHAC